VVNGSCERYTCFMDEDGKKNNLTDFIKAERERGKSDDDIKDTLIHKGGWSELDIDIVFNQLKHTPAKEGTQPTEQAQEEQTTYTPPPSNKKLIIGIVVAFVLVAGSAGAYFFVNQQADTGPLACTAEAKICPDGSSVGRTGPNCEFAECPVSVNEQSIFNGWQTYRNEEFEFEIQFPRNWTIFLNSPDLISLYPPGQIRDWEKDYWGDIFIKIERNPQNLTPYDFYSNKIRQYNFYTLSEKQTPFRIDNLDAVKFSSLKLGIYDDELPVTKVAINTGKKINVTVEDVGEKHQESGVFDAITATFKLIKPNKIPDLSQINVDLSKWQAYRNEEYGFEFKYPPELLIDELIPKRSSTRGISIDMGITNLVVSVDSTTANSLDEILSQLENTGFYKDDSVQIGNEKGIEGKVCLEGLGCYPTISLYSNNKKYRLFGFNYSFYTPDSNMEIVITLDTDLNMLSYLSLDEKNRIRDLQGKIKESDELAGPGRFAIALVLLKRKTL